MEFKSNQLFYQKHYTKQQQIIYLFIQHLHVKKGGVIERYHNDSILISYKTLNIDNPKLNCRIKSLSKFSPKRIILDKHLNLKQSSYIFQTTKQSNTIVFYNNASKSIRSYFIDEVSRNPN